MGCPHSRPDDRRLLDASSKKSSLEGGVALLRFPLAFTAGAGDMALHAMNNGTAQEADATDGRPALRLPISRSPAPLGISIEFVRKFVADHAARPGFAQMSTAEVCVAIVRPATLARRRALVDLVADQSDFGGKAVAATATVLVCHPWSGLFAETVDVMEQHASTDPHAYFWLDVLCHNQHGPMDRPADWFAALPSRIAGIGAVLAVASPWLHPTVLGRAWCLFEMHAALGSSARLLMRLPSAHAATLRETVIADEGAILRSISDLHVERAEASSAHERDMLLQVLTGYGLPVVSDRIKAHLGAWYAATVLDMCQDALGHGTTEDDARLLNHVGNVLTDLDCVDAALRCKEKCLAIRLAALGPAHPDTAASYGSLGNAYDSKGEFDRAIECHERSLQIKLDTLGANHPSTATTYNNIGIAFRRRASMHRSRGEFDKAVENHEKALNIKLDTLGPNHPETAKSFGNLVRMRALCGSNGRRRRARTRAWASLARPLSTLSDPIRRARASVHPSLTSQVSAATMGSSHPDAQFAKQQLEEARALALQVAEGLALPS